MRKKILIFILIIALIILLFNSKKNQDLELETIVKNLDTVWAIDFLPSGEMIFTERPGRVNIYDFKNEKNTMIAEIPIAEISESGLAGIAVDPDFNENSFIYLYYTYEINRQVWNRVVRFVYVNSELIDEKVLLDKIPAAKFHDGGRIKFGPDGKLYITTGDATDPSSSQDIDSLSGKILRMNKDGTIPEDNPFGNFVYSYGHRNPQGIAWNLETDTLYETEHGPTKRDEVNIIEIGKNYGWPTTCDQISNFENPIRCYTKFTLAPAGIVYYRNNLYISGLRGTQVRKITLDNDGLTILNEEELFTDLGRIRDVVEHDGYLYIATSNRDGRGILRLGDDKIIRTKIK